MADPLIQDMTLPQSDDESLTRAYCICCGGFRRVRIKQKPTKFSTNGLSLAYDERSAYCRCCGNEVYVPEVNDENCAARLRAFSAARL